MRTIHKTVLTITDTQQIVLPEGSTLLSVAEQNGALCLWYLCDTSKSFKSVHRIEIFGTGNPIPERDIGEFIGTVLTYGGQLVWHVFHTQMDSL